MASSYIEVGSRNAVGQKSEMNHLEENDQKK